MSVHKYIWHRLFCDRCGAMYNSEDSSTKAVARNDAYENAGWLYWRGKDLCAECVMADRMLPWANASKFAGEEVPA